MADNEPNDTDALVSAINNLTAEPSVDAPAPRRKRKQIINEAEPVADFRALDAMVEQAAEAAKAEEPADDELPIEKHADGEELPEKPLTPADLVSSDDTVLQAHLLRQAQGVEEWMKPEDEAAKRREKLLDDMEKINFENAQARRLAEAARIEREERETAAERIAAMTADNDRMLEAITANDAEIDRLKKLLGA